MHKPLFLAAAGSIAAGSALLIATALPAAAASSAPALGAAAAASATDDPTTGVTFVVGAAGTLSITSPSTVADLGSAIAGQTTDGGAGDFGNVEVLDALGSASVAWTATVASTLFSDGAGHTIPAADATYSVGTLTPGGPGTVTLNDLTLAAPLALSTTGVGVVTATAGTGDVTASWDPDMEINVPADAITGTYTGTVTHSVA
jgi:hypothetical protein